MFEFLFGNLTESYEKQISDFGEKLNMVATSLIRSTEENLQIGQYDLASLMDAEKCNQFTLFLGSELDSRFKKVEIEELNLAIFVGKRQGNKTQKNSNNMNSNNYSGPQSRYSKKDLCNKIASHYVRIFNLLGAILSAVNPERNMCARRINALYQTAVDDIESGYVKVCESDDTDIKNKLYSEHIYDIPGIKHLLNLYYFYLIQEGNINNPDEKTKIQAEFSKLSAAFNTVFLPTSVKPMPSIISETEQRLNESLNKLQVAAENRRQNGNNKGKNSTDRKIDNLMTLVQQLTDKVNDFKATNTTNQMSQADLENFKSTMQTDLSEFKGNFETKLDALQTKVDELLQKTVGQEATNTAIQNVQENTITSSLEKTEETPQSTDAELKQVENELDVPTPENLKLEGEGQEEPTENIPTMTEQEIADEDKESDKESEEELGDMDLGDENLDDFFDDLYPEEKQTTSQTEAPNTLPVDKEVALDEVAPVEVASNEVAPVEAAPVEAAPVEAAPPAPVEAVPPAPATPQAPAPVEAAPVVAAPVGTAPISNSNNTKNTTPTQSGGVNNETTNATNANQTATNANQTATNGNQTATNANQTATNGNQTATNANQTATNGNQTVTNSNQTATNANQTATNGNQTVTNSNQTATNGNQTVTNSNQTATNVNQTVTNTNPPGDVNQGVSNTTETETVSEAEENINPGVINTRNTINSPPVAENDLSGKSAIEKFLKFVEKHNKEYPSDSQYSLNLRSKTISEIASNYKCSNGPSKVMIKLNDAKYRDFKAVYQQMRNHYLSSTQKLFDILEESLVQKDKSKEPPEYKLKSITNKELNEVQRKVLQELTFYYTKCQEYYQDAFKKLSDALYPNDATSTSSNA